MSRMLVPRIASEQLVSEGIKSCEGKIKFEERNHTETLSHLCSYDHRTKILPVIDILQSNKP